MNTDIDFKWNGEAVKIKGYNAINRSIWEIGLAVEGQAKLLSPVITGRLAGSITTQSRKKGTNVESPAINIDEIKKPSIDNEVFVGTAVEYAPYKEFGTVKTSAKPFLRPALDLIKGKSLNIALKESRYEFKDYI